ncbi:MAG: hypothetical protein HUU16_07960, partial [Candidatus Omnitrophica bacterium]|nr:hypothetical protein [Candidatus Omnitrophota bacterium]
KTLATSLKLIDIPRHVPTLAMVAGLNEGQKPALAILYGKNMAGLPITLAE